MKKSKKRDDQVMGKVQHVGNLESVNDQLPVEPAINPKWRYVFWGFAVVILACMMFTATQVGATGDEFLDELNGEYALKYYTEHDTSFVNFSEVKDLGDYSLLKYYGVGYEILPSIMVRYFHLPESQIYLFRHLLCGFFGFLMILFTGLTAKTLFNWKAGIYALLLISLTPVLFGLSYFATKDIPFGAGFAIACYAFIQIIQTLPKFKVWHILLAIYGIALAVSVRVGGLMLPFYLVVLFVLMIIFNKSKRQMLFGKPYTVLFKSLGVGAGIVIVGALIGLCFYPNFFYEGPVNHVKNAFTLVSKFPQRIPFLWEGKMADSLNLPEHYLLKSFLYTVPLFVFGGLLLFLLNIVKIWKKYDRTSILFLLFTFFFPVFLVVYMKSNIYNGWRHETFAYPGLIVASAAGVYEFTQWFSKKPFYRIWKWLAPSLVVLSFIPTGVWMIRNYKYTYSYFNVIAGDPYMRFDMDYYETAQTVLLKWLAENELQDPKDTVHVGVKNGNAIDYQKRKQYENLSVSQASYKGFAESDADYSILSLQFLPKKYVKNFFPPKGTIKVETVSGYPVAALVKRNKLDSKGISLVRKGKSEEGMALLDSAYKYDPNNFGIWFWMGYGYFDTKEYKKCIEFFEKAEKMDLSQDQLTVSKMYTGVSQYELRNYEEAVRVLKIAERMTTDQNQLAYIKAHIALAYFKDEKYKEAIPYFKAVLPRYPHFEGNLNYCYSKVGGGN